MEEEQGGGKVRIFVGGLGESVTEEDLHRLFTGVGGSVHGIDIIRTKCRSFAYVDFFPDSDKSLSKLFATYNGCAWKGGKLKVHKAKEHYLVRLKREWAELEAAQLAAAAAAEIKQQQQQQTTQEAKTAPRNSTKQIRLFFPALRTVKPLPFSGTGKHKYSFQRLQVPSLPLHFCDCDEHAVSHSSPLQLNQSSDHVINAKEITIMNKVMDKLLQKEVGHVSDDAELNTAALPLSLPTQHHHELEAEEDDLIINIVSTKQEENVLSALQELRSSGTQVRTKINAPPNKKKKSLVRNNHNEIELEPDISVGKTDFNSRLNNLFGAQADQSQLGIQQSTPPVSWSQKCSWKQLVGYSDNSGFSVSRVLTGRSSTAHTEPKLRTSDVQQSDRNQDLTSSGSLEGQLSELEPLEENAEHRRTKSVSDSYKSGRIPSLHQDLSWTQLTNENIGSVPEQAQPNSGAFEVLHSDSEDQDLAEDGNLEGRLSQMEQVEEKAEPQSQNALTNSAKSGRGASWRQKSSWTQLINDNTGSTFSIAQILPAGISFKQQGFQKPRGGDIMSSFGSKLKETVKQDNLTRGESSSLGVIKKEGVSLPLNQQISTGNECACAPNRGETCDATPKQVSKGTVNKGKACVFVRSAASLNEWAKAKAALSGSRKRKNTDI